MCTEITHIDSHCYIVVVPVTPLEVTNSSAHTACHSLPPADAASLHAATIVITQWCTAKLCVCIVCQLTSAYLTLVVKLQDTCRYKPYLVMCLLQV